MMAKQFNYEVKTTIRLNMHNPDHVLINNVIQNLDPKIFKSKNQFILDACKFYIDNYGSETFIAKKKDNERAEYIRSADIEDIKTEVICPFSISDLSSRTEHIGSDSTDCPPTHQHWATISGADGCSHYIPAHGAAM